jgi:hypothetical protein
MANSSQPKSWRDVLPIQSAADLFPLMSESELRELGEDIKKNGLRSPIVLWSSGDQLDKPDWKTKDHEFGTPRSAKDGTPFDDDLEGFGEVRS